MDDLWRGGNLRIAVKGATRQLASRRKLLRMALQRNFFWSLALLEAKSLGLYRTRRSAAGRNYLRRM